jgi:hypothetical protein
MVMHVPWSLHVGSPGQVMVSHADPSNPSMHVHSPPDLSHVPMSLHSAVSACALSSSAGNENHDLPYEQVRKEQSAPMYPFEQEHA